MHIPITIHSNRAMGDRPPDAVEALVRAWNHLDVDAVESWFASDVRYSSPATATVLEGVAELRAYLTRKFASIEAIGDDARVRARPGWLDVGGERQWVVISGQGELDRAAVFHVELDREGQIARITVSADAVDRRAATELPTPRGRDVASDGDPR